MGDEVISTIPEWENEEFIKSSTDLKYSMPIDQPLHCTDVLEDTIVDINLPLGEHLDTLLTGDREIDFNPSSDIEELEHLLVDDPVPVPRVFDEPLGHFDSISRSFDVTFSNPLFDFNDDYTLFPPLLDPKQTCLRDVERFDPFFSLTQSGDMTWVMERPSYRFPHMPSTRPAAYSPKEVKYCYYPPHLTSGDGLDHGPKMK
ncbi:hypothetical protein Tco_0394456 [Tanacetum coccineum]